MKVNSKVNEDSEDDWEVVDKDNPSSSFSAVLLIFSRHTCQFGREIGPTFFEEHLRALETKKSFVRLLTSFKIDFTHN